MNADAGALIPTENRNSLLAWFSLYMAVAELFDQAGPRAQTKRP